MTAQLFPDHIGQRNVRHVLTIGNFDGVHRGHQYLLDLVVSEARSRGVSSAVITFDPLPLEVLRPEVSFPRLTSAEDRYNLIKAHGVDTVLPIRFSREVAGLEAPEFVRQVVEAFSPVEIIVGNDFAFGHNRSGNVELLQQLQSEYDFVVRGSERVGDDQQDFSSSRVRALLAAGDVRHAMDVLGRPYFLRGTVVDGKRRGRELGFPTANLKIAGNLAVPPDGIYAALTQIELGGALIPSMVYVGTNPTFDDHSRVIEVNLLDFEGDLYGQSLTVLFMSHVRDDQRFVTAQDLVDQMHKDQKATERVLYDIDDRWMGADLRTILELEKGATSGDR